MVPGLRPPASRSHARPSARRPRRRAEAACSGVSRHGSRPQRVYGAAQGHRRRHRAWLVVAAVRGRVRAAPDCLHEHRRAAAVASDAARAGDRGALLARFVALGGGVTSLDGNGGARVGRRGSGARCRDNSLVCAAQDRGRLPAHRRSRRRYADAVVHVVHRCRRDRALRSRARAPLRARRRSARLASRARTGVRATFVAMAVRRHASGVVRPVAGRRRAARPQLPGARPRRPGIRSRPRAHVSRNGILWRAVRPEGAERERDARAASRNSRHRSGGYVFAGAGRGERPFRVRDVGAAVHARRRRRRTGSAAASRDTNRFAELLRDDASPSARR